MNSKEKALELYNKMLKWQTDSNIYIERKIINTTAKQCALIAVDEIINALENYDNNTEQSLKESQGIEHFSCEIQNMDSDFRYWDKVKQEIHLL